MNEDRIWEMYFSSVYQDATRTACRNRIAWFLDNAHGDVLDLGCSQGLLPILLARQGVTVVGVDIEEPSLAFARARLADEPPEVQARVELVLADARTWDPGRRFDTVILGEVLEHLPDPAALVAAAARLVVDGGRLLVTVPMGWLEHRDHRQEFLPASLVALLTPTFGIETLDVVDDKLRVRAIAGAASRADVVAPDRLAGLVAATLLDLQHRRAGDDARDRLRVTTERLERQKQAHDRAVARLEAQVKQLKGKVERLAADKKRLRESGSYQLGSLLVGAGLRPRTALRLPQRLATLGWKQLRAARGGKVAGAPGAPRPAGSARDVYAGTFRVALPGARPVTAPIDDRVLHVLEYSLPHTQNGYTLRSFNIVQAQRQLGWDPVVVTRPGFPDVDTAAGPETVAGSPHYRLSGKQLDGHAQDLPRYIEAFAAQAAPIVAELRPSIVHAASNFRNAYPALELARTFRLPCVYEVRGLWEETRVANGTLKRSDARYDELVRVETYCARQADAVVTLGSAMKAALVQRGVPADKIFLVPNAVEAPAELPAPRPELLDELGLTGRFVVSYIGSVTPLESLHVLIDAISIIARRRRDVAALIIGDGAALEALRARVDELGIGDSVRFTGAVPHAEIRDYYGITGAVACTRGHDLVCSVVTPLKPYEAMAYARPVVVSDIPALREMVEDRVTGRLVRAEDPVALARVLEELADDPDERRALGARAAAWVREHRTWQRVADGYRPAYAYARDAFARRTQERP